jgi:hypothetical protein
MSGLKRLGFALLMAAQLSTAAWAGPFKEAEARVGQAYAHYRAALFHTNQKDKAATEAALAAFREKWAALVTDWKAAPPPQYVDDVELTATLDAVTRILAVAGTATANGELAKAHDILEAIRDQLGSLRGRNGIISFSDRMNAYHEVMERIVDAADMTPASALEEAGLLSHLAGELDRHRPPNVDMAAFEGSLKALLASVSAFQAAARSGNGAAIDVARRGLKQPYSRMFLRFG